jgi:hypothetical protein
MQCAPCKAQQALDDLWGCMCVLHDSSGFDDHISMNGWHVAGFTEVLVCAGQGEHPQTNFKHVFGEIWRGVCATACLTAESMHCEYH